MPELLARRFVMRVAHIREPVELARLEFEPIGEIAGRREGLNGKAAKSRARREKRRLELKTQRLARGFERRRELYEVLRAEKVSRQPKRGGRRRGLIARGEQSVEEFLRPALAPYVKETIERAGEGCRLPGRGKQGGAEVYCKPPFEIHADQSRKRTDAPTYRVWREELSASGRPGFARRYAVVTIYPRGSPGEPRIGTSSSRLLGTSVQLKRGAASSPCQSTPAPPIAESGKQTHR